MKMKTGMLCGGLCVEQPVVQVLSNPVVVVSHQFERHNVFTFSSEENLYLI